MCGGLSMEHIEQFCGLWKRLVAVHLQDNLAADLTWTLTTDGIYSSASAYTAQFKCSIVSNMTKVV